MWDKTDFGHFIGRAFTYDTRENIGGNSLEWWITLNPHVDIEEKVSITVPAGVFTVLYLYGLHDGSFSASGVWFTLL